MCHQSRAPVPRSEVILARLRVAPTRPPRAPSTARDATIFPPPHPPLHARLARSRASTTVPSRAADHPARLARSSTLARASNHPSSTTTTTTTTTTNATREHTRVHSTPSPSLSRIASHRIERDAPTTPRARVLRRDARPADGSDEWPRRGDRGEGLTTSHDRSRSRARTARAGIRSVDRAIDGVPCLDRCPGTTKNGQLSHT